MNALQRLITICDGNTTEVNQLAIGRSQNDTSRVYPLFIHILSFLKNEDLGNSAFVSKLWNRATNQIIPKLLLDKSDLSMKGFKNTEILIDEIFCRDCPQVYKIGSYELTGNERDVGYARLSESLCLEGKFEDAEDAAFEILNEHLKLLTLDSLDYTRGEKAIALAEEGKFLEARNQANKMINEEIQALANAAIDEKMLESEPSQYI